MGNLALTMRPEKLEDVIGNESTKKALKAFIDREDLPNVFLFIGEPGCGKTTLAEIVANSTGGDESSIHKINGSVQNKVDDAREISEKAQSSPLNGQRRVFLIDEFHRWTDAAMDAIKDTMEKTPALFLLTTDQPDKISSAVLSRASAATFKLKPLNRGEIDQLVLRAAPSLASGTGVGVADFLFSRGINCPREILGVLEQMLAGVSAEEAVHKAELEPLYTELSTAILSGNWTKTASVLKQIKTGDFRAMVAVVSAKLAWAMLECEVGPRAAALATCLTGLGNSNYADGVAYNSARGLFYKCVVAMGAK